ncbi:hypothetical protein PCG10_009931 [Penicillium crustosum]|uniref:Uncharacterized protein n=1 Tax=Penicillium crustosum TaxID=36656 RepID=A0A9P5GJK2_PENCR|nr:hypothetical protein PCG10_009931 [Penicillium crustosum]
MSPKDLDLAIQNIKDDREHMELLTTLSPQLQRLVDHGLPDLHSFYADLNGKKLLSECKLQELQNEYILKQDKLPSGKLDMAISILIKSIEENVLGQQKLDDDFVLIHG